MSTEATNAELNEAIMDEFGVKYSKDGRKLLKAPQNLDSTYSIKEGTKIICDMAFADCKSLRSLVVPDGVTSIGKRAFSDCTSLSSLVLPESVGNIIGNPFSGWDGELKCLSPYFIYDNKVLFDKDKSKIIAFRDKKAKSYAIPDSITSIENGAFYDCKSLSSLVIPDGVTSIGTWAFSGCCSLSDIIIPDGVTHIEERAFYGCNFSNNLKQELISRFGIEIFW